VHFKKLVLFTSRLEEQLQFYSEKLGLPCVHNSSQEFSVQLGNSLLVYRERKNATPYHFAINIPANKIYEAAEWVRSRTDLLKNGNEELVDFRNWNAFSVYFHDVDQNIIEFIARKNLRNERNETFDSSHLLEISEIGVPVDNVEECYHSIHSIFSLPVYWGSTKEIFCAAGDEHGLFIIIDKTKKNWFPSNEKAYSSDFLLEAGKSLSFMNGKIYST
jgi:catechol-2,3-dioxygenase